eukprot:3301825-Amphidinium_carterae.3
MHKNLTISKYSYNVASLPSGIALSLSPDFHLELASVFDRIKSWHPELLQTFSHNLRNWGIAEMYEVTRAIQS